MSNNKMVTKSDLQEFYSRILPYLGGMPDILANKFSKGDMYSTDEKMIGQWVDGKPLYAKTISCGALPNISTVVRQNTGVSNIEMCVVMDGVAISPTLHRIKTFPLDGMDYGYDSQNNQIIISSEADYTAYTESYVTINYTKTTDSAVSIGNDTDYSTTEKIVGTWIDGSPVYQKTIYSNSGIVTLQWQGDKFAVANNVTPLIADAKQILSGWGLYSNDDVTWTGGVVNVWVNSSATQWSVYGFTGGDKMKYLTLQYTKTS